MPRPKLTPLEQEILDALREQAILQADFDRTPERQWVTGSKQLQPRVFLHRLECGHSAILTGIERPVRKVACYPCARGDFKRRQLRLF